MIKLLKKLFGIIYAKFNSMSAPVKAATMFTICSFMQKGISMITVPIFTRLLTTEQYGVYSVYSSWYQIITIFATLNLSSGVFNNGMVKFEDDRNRFTSSLQGLSSITTTILFVVYIVAEDFWNGIFELPSILMYAMFVELFFVPAYTFWSTRQRFEYKYKVLVLVSLIISITSPIIGVTAVLSTEYKAEARVLSYVFVQVCVGLIFYIFNFYKGKAVFVKKYWKFALAFNIPLLPHYLSSIVLSQADRIMISRMIGSSEAAIYSIAYNVTTIMNLLISVLNNTFIPYTYNALKEEKHRSIREAANKLFILVGALCILVIAFAPEVIHIFATSDYYSAIWVVPPLVISVYLIFVYSVFCNIEFYFEENIIIMVSTCICAATNIALNYYFIQRYGFLAAGYTTFACYLLMAIVHYFASRKTLKKHDESPNLYDIRFVVLFSLLLFAVMFAMIPIYNHTIIRYAIIVVMLVVMFIKRDTIMQLLRLNKKTKKE